MSCPFYVALVFLLAIRAPPRVVFISLPIVNTCKFNAGPTLLVHYYPTSDNVSFKFQVEEIDHAKLKNENCTVRLTSIYYPKIEGKKFTATPGGVVTKYFFASLTHLSSDCNHKISYGTSGS
jgi:hypothetical protein